MISNEEVKHIAKLARLGLAEKEIERYQKELSSILDYIEKLKKVDVSSIAPTSHPFEVKNVTREDKVPAFVKTTAGKEDKSSSSPFAKAREGKEKLLDLAPETKNGYLKIKQIL